MLNDSVILTLFLGLGIFGTPTFIMSLWLMWLELRQTRELADYYCEKWEAAARRERRREHLEEMWFTYG